MKSLVSKLRAFTLLEILVVVAIIGIVAALLLPAIAKTKAKAKRAQCLNNLKQIGISFHSFGHDHNDKFPMQVSTNNGGSLEFALGGKSLSRDFYDGFRHLQALSNELGEPKLLICAADTRAPAAAFTSLRNESLSYFVGSTADYGQPDSILAGDRNIISPGLGSGPLLRLGANDPIAWTSELHQYRGTILFADGRADLFNSAGLRDAIAHSPTPQSIISTPVQAPANHPTQSESPTAKPGPGSVARLEEVFQNPANKPVKLPSHRTEPSNLPPQPGAGVPEPELTLHLTNVSGQLSNRASATSSETEPPLSVWQKWPMNVARLLGQWGYKCTYFFLFILLAVLITMELVRRRRRKDAPRP